MTIRPATLVACAFLAAGCSPREDAIDQSGTEVLPPETERQPLTADHVANLIAADGARHTVLVLTGPADPTGFDQVLQGIATGDSEWLELVPAIEPATDGLPAEKLQEALTTALTRNAAGVLALMPTHAVPRLVCSASTRPDERRTAARAAVEAVSDPALRSARTDCLGEFDDAA